VDYSISCDFINGEEMKMRNVQDIMTKCRRGNKQYFEVKNAGSRTIIHHMHDTPIAYARGLFCGVIIIKKRGGYLAYKFMEEKLYHIRFIEDAISWIEEAKRDNICQVEMTDDYERLKDSLLVDKL
jgi:hypothetical protein